MTLKRSFLLFSILFGLLAMNGGEAKAQNPATTIPLSFTKTVDAAKTHSGDPILAKTIQGVTLPDGTQLPKGSTVRGHVVEVRAFSFDSAPYAVQQPSILSIHFDQVVTKDGGVRAIRASIRALASRLESQEARTRQGTDESDSVGTMVLIGGGSFNPLSKEIVTSDGDIIGYNRRAGVFARILPAEYQSRYSHVQCDGSSGEQSVAIFSPVACGVYGFDSVYMAENGSSETLGTFRLESRRRSIKVYAGSSALLELINPAEHSSGR